MRLYGVKGFPPESVIPVLVWHTRAVSPERAEQLVGELPEAAGLRLQAIDIGHTAQTIESVSEKIPWPWPDKAA